MDLIDDHRGRAGLPQVPVGTTYDSGRDSLPRYIISVLPSEADRLEASPIFTVETLDRTYADAERLAYDVDDILMSYPLSTSSGGRVVLVDEVATIELPVEMSLESDTSTRRFLATYQARIRRG